MMRIPILPITSDEENELQLGSVFFDVLTPKMKGDMTRMTTVKQKSGTSSDDKGTALVIDVKGLQRKNINDVLLKRLRIRGMRTWFLTNIESVDDVFDAFNTDAECVLVPTHTVRSEEELEDILSVSDSVIPVLFVRKRCSLYLGSNTDYRKIVDVLFSIGFVTVAVFDLDDSIPEADWIHIKEKGGIIPCSFTGKISGDRFEELGFGRIFTVPE